MGHVSINIFNSDHLSMKLSLKNSTWSITLLSYLRLSHISLKS